MKFRLYREYGALNSKPVFDACELGLKKLGHTFSDSGIPVIWSVLWHGRMRQNYEIYYRSRKQNIPVLILEVGSLNRGVTWKVSLNHINNTGIYPAPVDSNRSARLNFLQNKVKNSSMLIACQHEKSLLWENMPSTTTWVNQVIANIRNYTDRKIIVRLHPRCRVQISNDNCVVETPTPIANTYDNFDFNVSYHCIINHSSGPAVIAGLNNVPVICSSSSLAAPISIDYSQIETPPDTYNPEWCNMIAHTEWTLDEIRSGYPLHLILSNLL